MPWGVVVVVVVVVLAFIMHHAGCTAILTWLSYGTTPACRNGLVHLPSSAFHTLQGRQNAPIHTCDVK